MNINRLNTIKPKTNDKPEKNPNPGNPLYERKETLSTRHTMTEQTTASDLLNVPRKALEHLEKTGLNTSNAFKPVTPRTEQTQRTSRVQFTTKQPKVTNKDGLQESEPPTIQSPRKPATFVAGTPNHKSRLSKIGARDKHPGTHQDTVADLDAFLSMPKPQEKPLENGPNQGNETILAQLEQLPSEPPRPTGDLEFDALQREDHDLMRELLSPRLLLESPAKPPDNDSRIQTRKGQLHPNKNKIWKNVSQLSTEDGTDQDFDALLASLEEQGATISPPQEETVKNDVPTLMRGSLAEVMARKQKDVDAAKKFCTALKQREVRSTADVEAAFASLGYTSTRQVFNFLMESPVFTLLSEDPTTCQLLIDYAVRLQTEHGGLSDLDIIAANLQHN